MTDMFPTYDADSLARMKAGDANLAGIVAGRRRAAAALLVTDARPAAQVRAAWSPLSDRPVAAPRPSEPAITGPTTWTGHGPPNGSAFQTLGKVGDLYEDVDTGTYYERTA